MEQCDDRNFGCGVTIYFNNVYDLHTAVLWLKKSGITQEYIDKILGARMSTKSSLLLEFDESANCFECIRQITDNHHSCLLDVTCTYGRFLYVLLVREPNTIPSKLKVIAEDLGKHGEVLKLARCKIEGVCTGDIEAVMFVQEGSKLLDEEWAKEKNITVKPFLSMEGLKLDPEKVEELWRKFGPKLEAAKVREIDAENRDEGNSAGKDFLLKVAI